MRASRCGSRRWRWFGVALATVLALALLVPTVIVVSSSCDDDVPCADPSRPERYAGRLFTGEGQPLPARVDLVLSSFQDHSLAVVTDNAGRFCVTLPREPELALVSPRRIVSDLPVDPRFAGPNGHSLLISVRAGDDSHEPQPARFPVLLRSSDSPTATITHNYSVAAWQPSQDQSTTCARYRKPAPWYRYQGLGSSWQAFTLLAAPIISWLLVLVGLGIRQWRRAFLVTGVLGLVASVVLVVAFLDIPRPSRSVPNPAWLSQK
jgi:hypothetical protein